MYNIHPTDFLIFSFDREAFQSKVLFQRPPFKVPPLSFYNYYQRLSPVFFSFTLVRASTTFTT